MVERGTGGRAVGTTSKWFHTLLGVRDTVGATFASVEWCAGSFESTDLSRRVRRGVPQPAEHFIPEQNMGAVPDARAFTCVGVAALSHVES